MTVGPCDAPGKPGVHPCIDYERQPNTYEFKVKAQDEEGNGPRPGYATLIIQILAVNDNPPVVQDYIVNIFENETVTTPDLYVEVRSLQHIPSDKKNLNNNEIP